MLLLLHLEDGSILEAPFDNVSVWRCALDPLALVQSIVEFGKVLELEQVPNVAERRLNDC